MYKPCPINTNKVVLDKEINELGEMLAKNTHDVWAENRIEDGWVYGPERNDDKKTTPMLVPYEELPESEKDYDRDTAMEALKVIVSLGYEIKRK